MKFIKRELPKTDGGSGMFLRFKDGEARVGVFKGEIYEFHQIWEGGKSKVVSDDHPGAKSRFRLNFLSKVDGEMKPQIFEFGLMVYNMLAEISEDYDLEKTAVKITRRGTGTDTTYIIIPAKEQPNAAQLKTLAAIELLTLEHKESTPGHTELKNYAPTGSDDGGDLPF
jgi:hypothetical protein